MSSFNVLQYACADSTVVVNTMNKCSTKRLSAEDTYPPTLTQGIRNKLYVYTCKGHPANDRRPRQNKIHHKVENIIPGLLNVKMWVRFQFCLSICWVMCERSFSLDGRKNFPPAAEKIRVCVWGGRSPFPPRLKNAIFNHFFIINKTKTQHVKIAIS